MQRLSVFRRKTGAAEKTVKNYLITSARMSYQIYQRDENDEAEITIKGELETGEEALSVEIDDTSVDILTMPIRHLHIQQNLQKVTTQLL